MTIPKLFRITTLIAAFGFLLLTGLVIKDRVRKLDFDLTVKLQDKISKRFDDEFVTLVDLGSMEIQTTLIILVILAAPVSKKLKTLLAVAYIAGLCITLLGKSFLPQPAPPFLLQRGTMGFLFPSSHVQVDASYPSGHTYRVVFLASLVAGLSLLVEQRTKVHVTLVVVTTALAGLILLGLVLLGKHWTTDVLGGIFLAVTLVAGSLAALPSLRQNSS